MKQMSRSYLSNAKCEYHLMDLDLNEQRNPMYRYPESDVKEFARIKQENLQYAVEHAEEVNLPTHVLENFAETVEKDPCCVRGPSIVAKDNCSCGSAKAKACIRGMCGTCCMAVWEKGNCASCPRHWD